MSIWPEWHIFESLTLLTTIHIIEGLRLNPDLDRWHPSNLAADAYERDKRGPYEDKKMAYNHGAVVPECNGTAASKFWNVDH